MSSPARRALRRLTSPRSRRNQLWACVYCGAFGAAADDVEDPGDAA